VNMSETTDAAFAKECDTFLSDRFERKDANAPRSWGQGSDSTAVFEEIDPDSERTTIAEVRAWRRLLWDHGYGWITGPLGYGGRGLPGRYQRIFDTAARQFIVPGNAKLTVSIGTIAPTILAHGTEGAKERYLRALHAGDLIACQLFSEPGAGSDLASVATKAVRDGDGWRIEGSKCWTSGAQFSDKGEVICRTSDGPRHENLTAFVVDMQARGVEVRPIRQMTGGAAFNEVFLTDVWVPDDDRLGDIGGGWRVAMTTLANERTALGDEGFGGAGLFRVERYVDMARALGMDCDQVTRDRLAELYCHLRVAKLTRQRIAARQRAGKAPGSEASIGKIQLSSNYRRISDFVSFVLGPRLTANTGEWGTYAWNDFVLGTPGIRLGGGTDEIIKNIIGERVLGLPKEPSG
jgi:alkylation response protein AidB-like acyl-CoA dehydrogenase